MSLAMQRTPEAGKHTPESKSVDSMGQQQQAQAQPASWSAIAAQGAAKGSGSPPAAGASGRSHGSGLSNRGSATDLRQEQVRPTLAPYSSYQCLLLCVKFQMMSCSTTWRRFSAETWHILPLSCALYAWYFESSGSSAWLVWRKRHEGNFHRAICPCRGGVLRRSPTSSKQMVWAPQGAIQHMCLTGMLTPHPLRPQCSCAQQVGNLAHPIPCPSVLTCLRPTPLSARHHGRSYAVKREHDVGMLGAEQEPR